MKKGSRLKKNFHKILPTEIVSDILARLPAESVLECKSVCKTWKNLIQHPSFPQSHLSRLNSSGSGKLRYVFLNEEGKDDADDYDANKHLYYFEYNQNEDWNHVKPVPRKVIFRCGSESFIVIGSFNGLICIYGVQPSLLASDGPAVILNPVTSEYIVLPGFDYYYYYPRSESIRRRHEACGYGYLDSSDEYKVVRIYEFEDGEPGFVEVEVYTLGSGEGWRCVGKFGLGFRFRPHWKQTHGVFLNGCLHWRNTQGGMVVVFDLGDEKFRDHIPPPPMLTETDDDEDVDGFIVMGVSGGGILYYAVCQYFQGRVFDDVWLLLNKNDDCTMKEQGEHQLWGWSKVSSLEQREPFAFMEGGTVLRYDEGNIKIFLSTTSTWINLCNFSVISRQVFPHKLTLVSLKELGEEGAEIMKFRGVEETDSSESGND